MFEQPFYAMRHGETSWNANGLFQGHSDISLSAEGREQARKNGCRLRRAIVDSGKPLAASRIFSSPLSRAVDTARTLCGELGISKTGIVIDMRLREVSFGRWEGLTSCEVKQRFPEERKARKRDRWAFAPDGGGSHALAAPEIEAFLRDLPHERISVLVTHSGNMRIMLKLLMGLAGEQAMRAPIPHDRIFHWNGKGVVWI